MRAVRRRDAAARVGVSIALVGGIHPLVTLIGWLLGMRPTAR